jgi:hypothetical protein
MTALGQKATSIRVIGTSASPPTADIRQRGSHARHERTFVPLQMSLSITTPARHQVWAR